MADGTRLPIIAGLAAGAAFVFLIGFVGNFPSGFLVSRWDADIAANETQIPSIDIQRSELEKYTLELQRGIDHIDQIHQQNNSPFSDPVYQSWLMGYETKQLMRNLPFLEMSHEDQNFRGHCVILKIKDGQGDYNYLISIYSIKPGRLFDY